MNNFTPAVEERFLRYKNNGILALCYALLLEFLFIGYLGFAALFTLEMLLPTFVSVRINLTLFFFVLFSLSFVLAFFGQVLDIHFPWNMHKKNLLLWIGLFWALCLFTLSLLNFPPLLIPLIIIAFLFVGFFFWNIFFGQ